MTPEELLKIGEANENAYQVGRRHGAAAEREEQDRRLAEQQELFELVLKQYAGYEQAEKIMLRLRDAKKEMASRRWLRQKADAEDKCPSVAAGSEERKAKDPKFWLDWWEECSQDPSIFEMQFTNLIRYVQNDVRESERLSHEKQVKELIRKASNIAEGWGHSQKAGEEIRRLGREYLTGVVDPDQGMFFERPQIGVKSSSGEACPHKNVWSFSISHTGDHVTLCLDCRTLTHWCNHHDQGKKCTCVPMVSVLEYNEIVRRCTVHGSDMIGNSKLCTKCMKLGDRCICSPSEHDEVNDGRD